MTASNNELVSWFQNIQYFRLNDFNDANESVKQSWYLFVGKIMPCVNKRWNDTLVRNVSLLSKNTSASDEAFAMSAVEKKINHWLTQTTEQEHCGNINLTTTSRNKKIPRDVWTNKDILNFYNLQIKLEETQKNNLTGEQWDLGYQKHLAGTQVKSNNITKNNNDVLKQAFVNVFDAKMVSSFVKKDVSLSTNNSQDSESKILPNFKIPIHLMENNDEEYN